MTNKISITDVDINSLRPNSWNSNVVNPENEERIKESINRFGIFRPIVVREVHGEEGFEILGGEHRWKVASSMGFKEVPIVNLGYIDDKKAKEIGLVDNGKYGDDDPFLLSEILKDLGDTSDIASFMPFDEEELVTMLANTNLALDELDIEDAGTGELPSVSEKSIQTHNIMRFKVPVQDSKLVETIINKVMNENGFTDDDSMMNAGNALVHIIKGLK